jgi:hypothetical protein
MDEAIVKITFRPSDVFFTRGETFISKAIRVCTRSKGEPRTQVNHVGAFVTTGNIGEAEVIEALSTVKRHTLLDQYWVTDDSIAVFRPIGLMEAQCKVIVSKLNQYEGMKYGYSKLVTHLLDWALNGRYVFRRLTNSDRYPICSWVVAQAFSHASLNFGVKPGAATPDDIWDFCMANPDKYTKILNLTHLR